MVDFVGNLRMPHHTSFGELERFARDVCGMDVSFGGAKFLVDPRWTWDDAMMDLRDFCQTHFGHRGVFLSSTYAGYPSPFGYSSSPAYQIKSKFDTIDEASRAQKTPKAQDGRFPHVCPNPRCKAPAYIGFQEIECSRGAKCR